MKFDSLLAALATVEVDPDAYNLYTSPDPNNALRLANLRLYLQAMEKLAPKMLLLAEAPGYRGCRLTGIPVTSRAVLLDGLGEWGVFGAERGYQLTADPGFENISREQSATILWSTLRQYPTVPLVWNTFPFHPHKSGQPRSNRRPRKTEIALGQPFVQQILDLFPFKQIVAVGNVAHQTLTQMQVPCQKVRHPAQGGKNDFVVGIAAIMQQH